MPRPEKVQAVADIKERLTEARAVFVAEYAGLSVKEQQQLRRAVRTANSEFKVYKMTLARIAAAETGHEALLDLLVGPAGLTFANEDAATTAKILRDFAKDHQKLVITGALLGTEVLPPERVAALADLEPRDVLLAKIAGVFQAPMARMAGLLAAMPRNFATMLQQLVDRASAGDAGPATETATTEAAPAAEAAAAPAEATTDDAAEPSAESEAPGAEAAADPAASAEATTDDEPAATAEEE